MVHRKSLVQVKFRLRQDILRKLEREAKRHDRSTNDEIGRRLEESFSYGDWREERQRLVTAVMTDLASHPNPAVTKAAIKLEQDTERDFQKEFMEEEFPAKGRKS